MPIHIYWTGKTNVYNTEQGELFMKQLLFPSVFIDLVYNAKEYLIKQSKNFGIVNFKYLQNA